MRRGEIGRFGWLTGLSALMMAGRDHVRPGSSVMRKRHMSSTACLCMRSRAASGVGQRTTEFGLGEMKSSSDLVPATTRTWARGFTRSTATSRNTIVLARSLDGGHSWSIEDPGRRGELVGTKGMRHGLLPPDEHEPEPKACPGGIDFLHPNFAMTLRMADVDGGVSRFYVSYDRAHNWKGPFILPLCGQLGIAARTDYLVNGKHDCLVFVTASKRNGREGRPVCLRTVDGGHTWRLISAIGPEPAGYAIMPSTVRLSPTDILTTIRRREEDQKLGGGDAWIDAYVSRDDGQSWQYLNRPAPDLGEGNPPALLRLRDGRLCLIYGVRKAPFRMEARMSRDHGNSWSGPFLLQGDGASRDLGYPARSNDPTVKSSPFITSTTRRASNGRFKRRSGIRVAIETERRLVFSGIAVARGGCVPLRFACTCRDHKSVPSWKRSLFRSSCSVDLARRLGGYECSSVEQNRALNLDSAGRGRDCRQVVFSRLVTIELTNFVLQLLAFVEVQL